MLLGLFGLISLATLLIASSVAARSGVARLSGASALPWFGADRQPWQRAWLACAAGSLAPLLVVWAIALLGHLITGESVPSTRVAVLTGGAETAGMKYGDRITAVDGAPVTSWEAVKGALTEPRKSHRIDVDRDAHQLTFSVTGDDAGRIGVGSISEDRPVSLVRATKLAFGLPFRVVVSSVDAFRSQPVDLVGPVGIVRETGRANDRGIRNAIHFIALLASYLWPSFVIAYVLDASTFSLFASTHPDARTDSPDERALWRVARLRQALHIVLVLWLPAVLWWSVSEGTGGGGSLLFLAWLGPVLFPLAALLAAAIRGRLSAALYVLALMVPILNLVAIWHLSRAARRHLAAHGIAATWRGARREASATWLS